MSIFSLSFIEVMLFIYSFVIFSKAVILWLFSVKAFIKSFISWAKNVSQQMSSARDKNALNNPVAIFGQMIKCRIIWTFASASLRILHNHQNNLSCLSGSWLLRTFKNSVALFLLLNRANVGSISAFVSLPSCEFATLI